MKLIDKDALVAEIKKLKAELPKNRGYKRNAYNHVLHIIDSFEVKELDIDKMCKFKNCIGYAFPDNASESQKYLACYRQGIEDALGILKQGLV